MSHCRTLSLTFAKAVVFMFGFERLSGFHKIFLCFLAYSRTDINDRLFLDSFFDFDANNDLQHFVLNIN